MPFRPYIIFLIFLLAGLWTGGRAAFASGDVSGQILYGAMNYRGEVNGEEVRTVRTDYQQVALRYQTKGALGDKRAGHYTLMLGYEFNRLNPTVSDLGINDPDYEMITTKKLFYNGDIVIAPGGLPFRLTLFARDLHQSLFVDEGTNAALPVSNDVGSQGSLIDPLLYTGIENGAHRELGGTLLIGIRNGSYLGLYRDVLSQVPRLLIDYKQIEVKDLAADQSRQHYRSRDLAFVSLNKLDNWVHFRMRDYTDFLNSDNDTTEKQVMIGLIDQLLQRRWVNMTNWLRVSSDLSYSTLEGAVEPVGERTYLVNLMAVGRQQNLNTSVLSSFSRTTDGETLEQEADLPISMTYEMNRDTLFRSRFTYDARRVSLIDNVNNASTELETLDSVAWEDDTRDCYLDLNLEMFRSRRIIVVPRFEVESRRENSRDGLAMRIGSEVFNDKLSKTFNWLGGYTLTTNLADDPETGSEGRYLENKIYGHFDKDFSRSLRGGADGVLSTGSGRGGELISFMIPRMSSQLSIGGGNGVDVAAANEGSRLTNGTMTIFLEHRYQQLLNRFEANYQFVAVEGAAETQTSVSHTLEYEKQAHRFKWGTVVNQGDNSGVPQADNYNYLIIETSDSMANTSSWSSDFSYRYDPSRSYALNLKGTLTGSRSDKQTITSAFSEKMSYRIFTTNGIIRCLAEFSEEIGLEQTSGIDVNGRNSILYGRFAASYYPTKYLYAKLHNELIRYSDAGLQQINIYELGLNYEKFKIIASYTEGKKDAESELLPEVMERLWNVEVRKIF